jgi:hypothetical protein
MTSLLQADPADAAIAREHAETLRRRRAYLLEEAPKRRLAGRRANYELGEIAALTYAIQLIEDVLSGKARE